MKSGEENRSLISDYTRKLTVAFIYALVYAVALNFFWRPGQIFTGGITGFSQIVSKISEHFLGKEWSISVIYYLLNIPLLIFG